MPSAAPPQVNCPTCKRRTVYGPANAWRPFCSERCRRADLGAWASEQFRLAVPASTETPDEGDADAPAPPATPP